MRRWRKALHKWDPPSSQDEIVIDPLNDPEAEIQYESASSSSSPSSSNPSSNPSSNNSSNAQSNHSDTSKEKTIYDDFEDQDLFVSK